MTHLLAKFASKHTENTISNEIAISVTEITLSTDQIWCNLGSTHQPHHRSRSSDGCRNLLATQNVGIAPDACVRVSPHIRKVILKQHVRRQLDYRHLKQPRRPKSARGAPPGLKIDYAKAWLRAGRVCVLYCAHIRRCSTLTRPAGRHNGNAHRNTSVKGVVKT